MINAVAGDFGFTDLVGRRICLARFDHLKHRMVVLLMGEFARNAPALMKIEFYGHGVRLHDSEAARLVTARSDLRFTLREQFPANAVTAVFAKHPQIADPFLICQQHADNLRVTNSDPSQRPILFVEF